MAVRDDRSDVKQTTAGFRVLLMVQSLTSAKSKFLSLGVVDWQEVDSWERGGKRYRFQTRYDDREIVEVVNNGTMCYSNTVRGNLYFKNKKLKFTEEIRFKCRYVR